MFDLIFKTPNKCRTMLFDNPKNLARFLTNMFSYYQNIAPECSYELFVAIRRKDGK